MSPLATLIAIGGSIGPFFALLRSLNYIFGDVYISAIWHVSFGPVPR